MSPSQRPEPYTLGFLIHTFLGRPEIVDVWGLGGPGGLKAIPEGGGLRPLPSGGVVGAAGVAQTTKTDGFRPAQKPCIKNPSVHCILWEY